MMNKMAARVLACELGSPSYGDSKLESEKLQEKDRHYQKSSHLLYVLLECFKWISMYFKAKNITNAYNFHSL